MAYSFDQLWHVAKIANKQGGRGNKLETIIPPQNATDGEFDFDFVFSKPLQKATDKHWTD